MQAQKADLYLLLEPDLPWVDDGTRFFSEPEERHRFARITEQVLIDAKVPFVRISGSGTARYDAALRAMGALDV
jgi:nicotinamide riboside kinase